MFTITQTTNDRSLTLDVVQPDTKATLLRSYHDAYQVVRDYLLGACGFDLANAFDTTKNGSLIDPADTVAFDYGDMDVTTPDGETVTINYLSEPAFTPGDRVRDTPTGLLGTVISALFSPAIRPTYDYAGAPAGYNYQVKWADGSQYGLTEGRVEVVERAPEPSPEEQHGYLLLAKSWAEQLDEQSAAGKRRARAARALQKEDAQENAGKIAEAQASGKPVFVRAYNRHEGGDFVYCKDFAQPDGRITTSSHSDGNG